MIRAFALILCFQLGGEVVSRVMGLPLPGPVLGMVGLLGGFAVWPGLASRLAPTIKTLLAHLSLFFVPAGVGVISHGGVLADYGVALFVVLVVSTILSLAAGVGAFVAVARLGETRARGRQ